ncbi:hypothetical protein CQA49_08390 [Helicobacter sp. MIT 00-7814]|uniref:hypothetical protein n=1 Tax=unclassified Helicobacter TaxID=2593540 RepID=UPI000E1ECA38|nr:MULTISPECIES: hypothetical protein [unclassified Helicobacter]RDU52452.1 hypothetical protein CQA49_08390 [Helicobacter sp. MIT 00-7814]RDU53162.1 hypothetical protein CQA37_07420 [Helicobacter sp. MIT 99-10781]
MSDDGLQNLENFTNLKINAQALLQLETQDFAKIKEIVLSLKERHLHILAQTQSALKENTLQGNEFLHI